MKVTRIIGLLTLAASIALTACGGGGAPTTATPAAAPTSSASAYTGPGPTTADVQAFEVNFWNNVRVQNRCGQCHNATTPAQMPNFARSDNVNLAYTEANTVVNLAQPSASRVVVKVSGGHNCWLADNNACGAILTTWISNWAGATGVASATQVQLTAPPIQSVGQSLNFPASATDYQNTIYTITGNPTYCQRCHSSTAGATQQSPFFADPTLTTAYPAAIPKIDLTGCSPFIAGNTIANQSTTPPTPGSCGTNSRFYQRLLTDNHNCWSDCKTDAALMLAQIQAFAKLLTPSNIDPTLVISKALSLSQGTVASGASRFDADTIAKYEFQTGTGYVAYDTSGIDPSADLTITGNVLWAGGWGIIVGAGGKAQATTAASSKLYTLIQATGEFSIEAWVAPALVAADNSYMVSYSGGDSVRNFTLGQTNQDYDFLMRSPSSDLNGMPQQQTSDAAMVLQASLQHVVLTYDAVNGRQIYVNGVNTATADPQKSTSIANWDSSFALVLGNEVSGKESWQGLIKFVAIHSRALSAPQILQNFNAGVGQRYYMLFNVSNVPGVNVPEAYVMLTVSQYDSTGYLFYKPTFISLDPTAKPTSIPVKGMRIGINGAIPNVGQAYIALNTTVTAANYTPQGQVLSNIGMVIGLESGPLTDKFFLQFDQLGTASKVIVEPIPTPPTAVPGPIVADVGVRAFAQINSTFSALTGVPTNNAAVVKTYQSVQQQLPAAPTLESFSSANQVGIAQLAFQYCSQAMNTASLQQKIFPGVTFNGTTFPAQASTVANDLAVLVVGNGVPLLKSQPSAAAVSGELTNLIGTLCKSTACTNTGRTVLVATAACAAALGSAETLIN